MKPKKNKGFRPDCKKKQLTGSSLNFLLSSHVLEKLHLLCHSECLPFLLLTPIWACELAPDTSCAYASPVRIHSQQLSPATVSDFVSTALAFPVNCWADLGEDCFEP